MFDTTSTMSARLAGFPFFSLALFLFFFFFFFFFFLPVLFS